MSELVVRRLLVDLKTPIARHWCGGDAFRTALFNALSFSFPRGEQVFIDSVRHGLAALPPARRVAFEAEVRGFIGQEATHRRVHTVFNEHLERQGLVNHLQHRIERRARQMEGIDPRGWLGVTAATEHFTAILAEYLLKHEAPLAGAEERLRTLWLWHSSEESEHRASAFDLYRELGGNEYWRRRLFHLITWYFATDIARQTLHNLWRDGTWWRWSTWRSAASLLFGREGIVPFSMPRWRRYREADFHPSESDGEPGRRWLAANAQVAPAVNAPVETPA
jgi:hypothetical protein